MKQLTGHWPRTCVALHGCLLIYQGAPVGLSRRWEPTGLATTKIINGGKAEDKGFSLLTARGGGFVKVVSRHSYGSSPFSLSVKHP
jgi:hypothetical protein